MSRPDLPFNFFLMDPSMEAAAPENYDVVKVLSLRLEVFLGSALITLSSAATPLLFTLFLLLLWDILLFSGFEFIFSTCLTLLLLFLLVRLEPFVYS